MKNVVFLDVDTQEDYMNKDFDSYISGSEEIIPNLKRITEFANKNDVRVIASVDKNSDDDSSNAVKFNSKIKETSLDFVRIPDRKLSRNKIREFMDKNVLLEKQNYSAFANKNLHRLISNVKRAYVYGVATDLCIKAAVFDLLGLKIETFVVKDAIKGTSFEKEQQCLDLFIKRGAKLLTTSQLLSRKSL